MQQKPWPERERERESERKSSQRGNPVVGLSATKCQKKTLQD